MANETNKQERLAALFEAYGSDTARWPAAERAGWQAFESQRSAALLREEQAVDRVLRSARDVADAAPAPDALVARILAALPETGATQLPAATGASSVVPLRRQAAVSSPRAMAQRSAAPREWKAASALLAASLVLGLFIGSTNQLGTAVQGFGEYAGLSTSQPTYTSALDEALAIQDDEEIL